MWLFAQDDGGSSGLLAMLVPVLLFILIIAGMWGIFAKAGKPGWAAIIPIYNAIVLLEVVGRPIWWFILLLIPCVSAIVGIILCVDLTKSFGKGIGFAIGLILFGFIFIPLLGLGGAKYVGPAAASGKAGA